MRSRFAGCQATGALGVGDIIMLFCVASGVAQLPQMKNHKPTVRHMQMTGSAARPNGVAIDHKEDKVARYTGPKANFPAVKAPTCS